uniref:Zinc finger Y-chromosomal protein n=1 Tax=Lygus hesperus TaxID=30085 RepID=A0A0A9XLM0_LYGHE
MESEESEFEMIPVAVKLEEEDYEIKIIGNKMLGGGGLECHVKAELHENNSNTDQNLDDSGSGSDGDDHSSAVDLSSYHKPESEPRKTQLELTDDEKAKLPSNLELIKHGAAFSNSIGPHAYNSSLDAFVGNPHFMQALAAFGLLGGSESSVSTINKPGSPEPRSLRSGRGRTRRLVNFPVPRTIQTRQQTSARDVNDNGVALPQKPLEKADDLLYCSFCDYSTKRKGTLNIHMLKHASKQFSCSECSYTTSRSSDLKKHFRIHTGEKPFKCEECDYRSTELGALRKHMLTHSCDNPHCCPHCEYVSPRIGDLKRHMHIHSDKKPHQCQHCDYKAAQLQHLRKHMLIHTGIKPYQCTYCEYRCREPRNLKTHIQTHTGDRPYGCPHCQYKAGRLGTLRRHITSIHPTNDHTNDHHPSNDQMGIPDVSQHFLVGNEVIGSNEHEHEEEDEEEETQALN